MSFGYPVAIERAAFLLGSPYQFGSKLPILVDWKSIIGQPTDCSGLSLWTLFQAGVKLPDGAANQFKVCTKLPAAWQGDPPALALGFYSPDNTPEKIDHVVVSMGAGVVIEARGEPYNCVICRPVAAWAAQKGFLGFYAPPGLGFTTKGTP